MNVWDAIEASGWWVLPLGIGVFLACARVGWMLVDAAARRWHR